MYSAALTCALLALASCQLAIAFRFTQNINFSRCHEQLLGLNNTAFNDPAQFAVWNNNRTFVSNPRQLVLTFHGCEKICGDGYQLWPSKDTLGRLSLWVLPAIILLTHFHFPPLRWHNTMAVIIHAAGDPLDSLWSMLIRDRLGRAGGHLQHVLVSLKRSLSRRESESQFKPLFEP